jgi:hypothetical protein
MWLRLCNTEASTGTIGPDARVPGPAPQLRGGTTAVMGEFARAFERTAECSRRAGSAVCRLGLSAGAHGRILKVAPTCPVHRVWQRSISRKRANTEVWIAIIGSKKPGLLLAIMLGNSLL